jgi:hypothetical protein
LQIERATLPALIRRNRGAVMSTELSHEADAEQPRFYHIRIKGHLGQQWADWFEGLAITPEDAGETVLAGMVADQAALHGLLRKVRDLGMPLLSVVCAEPDLAEAPEPE